MYSTDIIFKCTPSRKQMYISTWSSITLHDSLWETDSIKLVITIQKKIVEHKWNREWTAEELSTLVSGYQAPITENF